MLHSELEMCGDGWVYVVCVHTLIPMYEFGMFVHPVCVLWMMNSDKYCSTSFS